MLKYYSNGKLLISGEYLVLNGAKALAVPTKFGQTLEVLKKTKKDSLKPNTLVWQSIDYKGKVWFEVEYLLPSLNIKSFNLLDSNTKKIAITLQNILLEARKYNPDFLQKETQLLVKTKLNFPRNWGLGTSSTLINNVAQWANVDAFSLQFKVFGGSAYDIACAQNDKSIIYWLVANKPKIRIVDFNPNFKDNLYFVYLNKKMNSRNAINSYKNKVKNVPIETKLVNEIAKNMINPNLTIQEFASLIVKHEQILSDVLGIEPIKKQLFKDYFGQIKSLGAWGGDFILVTGNEKTPLYFKQKGYKIVLKYGEMVK